MLCAKRKKPCCSMQLKKRVWHHRKKPCRSVLAPKPLRLCASSRKDLLLCDNKKTLRKNPTLRGSKKPLLLRANQKNYCYFVPAQKETYCSLPATKTLLLYANTKNLALLCQLNKPYYCGLALKALLLSANTKKFRGLCWHKKYRCSLPAQKAAVLYTRAKNPAALCQLITLRIRATTANPGALFSVSTKNHATLCDHKKSKCSVPAQKKKC